jgi:4-hydroxybenzoate polyprenyltransferase
MKPLALAQILLSVSVIALALLQLTGIWPNAIYLYEPLIGVVLLVQAAQNWNRSRPLAYFSLFVSILLFGTTAYIVLR